MMARYFLEFKLSSYWHIGSGTSTGAVADAVVVRDAQHLPVIPGRTIKGLLRDAMELATLSGRVPHERVEKWFGSVLPGSEEALDAAQQQGLFERGRFSTREGELWFGSANLPEEWRKWAASSGDAARDEGVIRALFTHVASTAIEWNGVAREHSLRVTEVAVPMTLRAEVRGPDGNQDWVEDLNHAVPLLRALGSRRSRGFGRVDVKLEVAK